MVELRPKKRMSYASCFLLFTTVFERLCAAVKKKAYKSWKNYSILNIQLMLFPVIRSPVLEIDRYL